MSRSGGAWAVDALFTAAGAALGGLIVLAMISESPSEPVHVGAELVIGAVAGLVLLLFRRGRPVATALVLIPAMAVSVIGLGMALVALFSVAVRRRALIAAVVAGGYAVTFAGWIALVVPDAREARSAIAFVLLLQAVLVASGLLVRSQGLLVRSLRERAREAEEGQQLRVVEARRQERERIAREMHDALAHRISLLTLHAGALEYGSATPEQVARAAGTIRSCAFEAAEDLREVIGVLRAPDPRAADAVRPMPTLRDLPELVAECRQAGVTVTLESQVADLGTVPAALGRHMYRIVQEGLTNARKHAPGIPVLVCVAGRPGDGLVVEVRNRLPAAVAAAPSPPGAGAGLVGLTERVGLARGRLEHGPTPDGQFRLWAWLAWPAP